MELGRSTEMQNDVMVILAKHVISTVANGSNFVFSPISINLLLCLFAAGSSCVSKQQILSFLMSPSSDHLNAVLAKTVSVVHANGSERSDLRLSMATGVWIDQSLSIKPSFKEVLENSFKGNCSHVDFFNKDICENSHSLMVNLKSDSFTDSIEAIRYSKLLLANAVYFKGAWRVKFDPKLTENNDFHLLDGTSVKVPFMTNDKMQYLKGYDGFQVLAIPYVEDLQRSEPGFFDNHLPRYHVSVDAFRIPKFKFSFDFKASDILMDMGLTSPFTHGGGLTEMVDSSTSGEKLHVSSIIHKAFIEVDEAAAVCYSTQDILLLENPVFVADHPFLFTVREDKSGVILFMGQVLDPSKH
ncbi:hypothetical protein N665_0266s0045 [Sinapis alba]|nr:hypothetical protein N665_0266s0045 [Sinapis alba]